MKARPRSTIRVVLYALLHQLFCPYVLAIIVAAATFVVVATFHGHASTASYVLTGTPFFPIQIAVGLVIGFLVGRLFGWSLASRTSIIPALLLGFSMMFVPPVRGSSIWGYWFGWSGAPGRAFPALQAGLTMPFYLSGAYSLASLVGQRTRRTSV